METIGRGVDSEVYLLPQRECVKIYGPHITTGVLSAYHELHASLAQLGRRQFSMPFPIMYRDIVIRSISWEVLDVTQGSVGAFTRYTPYIITTEDGEEHIVPGEVNPCLASYVPYIEGGIRLTKGGMKLDILDELIHYLPKIFVTEIMEYVAQDLGRYVDDVSGFEWAKKWLHPMNVKLVSFEDEHLHMIITDLGARIIETMRTINLSSVRKRVSQEMDELLACS